MVSQSKCPPLILASGSPRRKELMASLGLDFQVILPTIDESAFDVSDFPPREQVLRLAQLKGQSIASSYPESVVIASDTMVAIDGVMLGKPQDEAHAHAMLTQLQGQQHSVYSAIGVFHRGKMYLDALETKVWMRPLSSDEIYAYIATGEPMDKAGSYAIQGVGSTLVERIEGCYFNVVGMSLFLLNRLVAESGYSLVLDKDV